MKVVIPLVAAVLLLGSAAFAVFRPDRVRSWLREEPLGVLPTSVRELGVRTGPVIFAIGGAVLGLAAVAAFVLDLVDLVR